MTLRENKDKAKRIESGFRSELRKLLEKSKSYNMPPTEYYPLDTVKGRVALCDAGFESKDRSTLYIVEMELKSGGAVNNVAKSIAYVILGDANRTKVYNKILVFHFLSPLVKDPGKMLVIGALVEALIGIARSKSVDVKYLIKDLKYPERNFENFTDGANSDVQNIISQMIYAIRSELQI